MDEDTREVLRALCIALRDVTEQSFRAQELAEEAIVEVRRGAPPDTLDILNSKHEALKRIDEVIRKLQK